MHFVIISNSVETSCQFFEPMQNLPSSVFPYFSSLEFPDEYNSTKEKNEVHRNSLHLGWRHDQSREWGVN